MYRFLAAVVIQHNNIFLNRFFLSLRLLCESKRTNKWNDVNARMSPLSRCRIYVYWRIMQKFYWFDLRLWFVCAFNVCPFLFRYRFRHPSHVSMCLWVFVSISFCILFGAHIFQNMSILIWIYFVSWRTNIFAWQTHNTIRKHLQALIYVKES